MVQSLNTKVDLTVKATSYLGLANYGEVMVGDKAFEFYNEKNIRDYIQIPWEEVNCVMASVMFKGKWITLSSEHTPAVFPQRISLSQPHLRALLRAINKYIPSENLVRSLSFFQVIKRGLKSLFRKKSRQ